MTTGIQEKSEVVLTPQEAEAVLELWARRQAECELRSRLNVQDLAEATGLPIEEIERMVTSVRATRSVNPVAVPAKKAKPVNTFLIALAVIVWLGILAGVGTFAYEEGMNNGRRPAIAFAPPAFESIGTVVEVPMPVPASDAAKLLPTGMRAQIRGTIVEGTSNSQSAGSIARGLLAFAKSSAPAPLDEVVELDAAQVQSFLNPNGPANDLVYFTKLTGAGPKGHTFEANLPFVRKRNAMLESAAEAARSKLLSAIGENLMGAR